MLTSGKIERIAPINCEVKGFRSMVDILGTGTGTISPKPLSPSPAPSPLVLDAGPFGAQAIMSNSPIGAPVRLTLQEFANREGVPLATVRWWVNQGTAPRSYRLGRRRVMDLDDVIRWETELKETGSPR